MFEPNSTSRVAVLALLACLITGCGSLGTQETKQIADAKEAVKGLLTDPGSAEFESIEVRPAGGKPETVCGRVNAKNRMGGYNGFAKFFYVVATQEAKLEPTKLMDTIDEAFLDTKTSLERNDFELEFMRRCMDSVEELNAQAAKAERELKELQKR
jgi:hypothetical protein